MGRRSCRARRRSNTNRGAVTVELAVALMFMFFMIAAFFQLVQIFVGHERLMYAAHVAGRAAAVEGGNPQRAVAMTDPTARVTLTDDGVRLRKTFDTWMDFRNIFARGGSSFTVEREVRVYREPHRGGDNWE